MRSLAERLRYGAAFRRVRGDDQRLISSQGEVEGIRQGNWKLLVKVAAQNRNNPRATPKPAEILLFDLASDVGESTNLAESHPDIVERLTRRISELDAEITANARQPWMKAD
ncbi:MAG: hypothetical protein KDA96_12635 [Planctomycetaceae bacterium]|nr:hypothetical protein [Planctomycetaceae bacterium]